ncbi:MAG: Eco57I restriction-modification methylase domain-containing protein [Bacilli bacterium]
MEEVKFTSTFKYKLIYIFRINDENHKGFLKIGDATVEGDEDKEKLLPNCDLLNKFARKRINNYTSTAGIVYELLHTELAITNENKAFRDHDVHTVLKRSSIKQKLFDTLRKQNDWYEVDLETAKKAIKAVKNNRKALDGYEISKNKNPIIFRPEQDKAIEDTIKLFKNGNKMLWNAKMRFGKTLSALEVAKKIKSKRTIIITHRPVVEKGWSDDFDLIFDKEDNYKFGSKSFGESLKNLLKSDSNFIYFVSMQDLRGSKKSGGKFEKNLEIFNTDWDFVVIDEAHEGTQTDLGKNALEVVIKPQNEKTTKVLELSGTPFNLLNDYNENEIYTWDYVMEQEAKYNWIKTNCCDSNPYEELPKLNIFTYQLNKIIAGYEDILDKAFNFKEFFRTWTGNIDNDGKAIPSDCNIGTFVHEKDVNSFLNILTQKNQYSNYPYSTEEYRNNFKHSLWIVPGVKEAKALSKLLQNHEVFKHFEIANVAGDGDEEKDYSDSLNAVKKAIKENEYTITISCGRLTTGVSVPEWTAVFMLSGSHSTGASNYLQTIFRVQTPANIDGKIKEDCYVFDFAPDRTLRMVSQAGQLSVKAGDTSSKEVMGKFLNFCPVIGISGSKMIKYDVTTMLRQLKKAYASKVVRNGFDDVKIYNDKLLKLNNIEINEFNKLKEIIGASKQTKQPSTLDINKQGLDKEEYERLKKLQKKKELSEHEKEELEQKKQVGSAVSILRGISIRIPLLIYGANIPINQEVNCNNFVDLIDDQSWQEFMPKGVDKQMFKKFSKYYDQEIFIEAGKQIRDATLYADTLSPDERIKKIANIFSTFKNPDKETVLTPWRTVNMHLGDTLGGYNFFDKDEDGNQYIISLEDPRFISQGEVTTDTLATSTSKILEINSKTGLYPLYVTYSIYRQRKANYSKPEEMSREIEKILWKQTVEDNIFVLCKTDMAKSITKRTLSGYNDYNENIISNPNIIQDILNDETYINTLLNPKTWKKDGEKMKFDAIVGNPPYQEMISTSEENSSLGKQLFPNFVTFSIKMKPNYVSLITPSRWFAGDAQDKSFLKLRMFIKEQNHISKIVNFPNCNDVFDNVTIKGGVSYFLYEDKYAGLVNFITANNKKYVLQKRKLFEDGLDIILSDSIEFEIIKKVKSKNFRSLIEITKGRNAFGIIGKKDIVEKISKTEKFEGSIKLQCKNEEIRWTDEKYIIKNIDVYKKHKVFISKSAGDPSKDKKVIGKPYYAGPYTCCTDSLIPIGSFETMEEAINLQKYMKTKFLRYMVSILKVSQNVSQNVYQFVPLQNFTDDSDINWKLNIEDLDLFLYKKYNLSEFEIETINSTVREDIGR